MADYYSVLGVDATCSTKDLKQAYRSLALKNHPDLNAGNPDALKAFAAINEAYEVLSDDRKRAAYDKMRSVDMRVPTGGNCQGKDAFDASMAQFWKEYGHRFRQDDRKPYSGEQYWDYARKAAAWEEEKKEAKLRKIRMATMKENTNHAHRRRSAITLRKFWQSGSWGTRQDYLFGAVITMGSLCIAYTWYPFL